MGFLDFMGSMVQGEQPAKDQNEHEKPQTTPPPSSEAPASSIQKDNPHSFPVVQIHHLNPHINGDRLQLYCWIKNDWPEPVMLDKIHIFNKKRELDTMLSGHGEHEFLVYDGPLVKQEYHEAQLDYKTHKEGDYFQAIYDVRYVYHPQDKTYQVSELHLRQPIRDIYG